MNWWHIPEDAICGNCKEHKATELWGAGNSFMEINHGAFYDWWCKHCILQAQLTYAEETAAAIPRLKADLEIACQD